MNMVTERILTQQVKHNKNKKYLFVKTPDFKYPLTLQLALEIYSDSIFNTNNDIDFIYLKAAKTLEKDNDFICFYDNKKNVKVIIYDYFIKKKIEYINYETLFDLNHPVCQQYEIIT